MPENNIEKPKLIQNIESFLWILILLTGIIDGVAGTSQFVEHQNLESTLKQKKSVQPIQETVNALRIDLLDRGNLQPSTFSLYQSTLDSLDSLFKQVSNDDISQSLETIKNNIPNIRDNLEELSKLSSSELSSLTQDDLDAARTYFNYLDKLFNDIYQVLEQKENGIQIDMKNIDYIAGLTTLVLSIIGLILSITNVIGLAAGNRRKRKNDEIELNQLKSLELDDDGELSIEEAKLLSRNEC